CCAGDSPMEVISSLAQSLAVRCRCFLTTSGASDLTTDVLSDLTAWLSRTSDLAERIANATSLPAHGLTLQGHVQFATQRRTADLTIEMRVATRRQWLNRLRLNSQGDDHREAC